MRSLQDLYDSTENIDDPTLFYLFANCEPKRIKVVQDKKWMKRSRCNDPKKSASHICIIPKKD